MLRLRPYRAEDAGVILSWTRDEEAFYKWSAGVLGEYPLTEEQFNAVQSVMPFVAFDESGVVGFFSLRQPGEDPEELRFGFVIVSPLVRGKGYGKEMLRLGLKFAFAIYGAKRVTLGVFENNSSAYHCYRAVGFRKIPMDPPEYYKVFGQEWKCLELMMEKPENI